MTTKCIVYVRPDGGVSVVVPAPQAQLPDETEDDFLARIQGKDVPAGVISQVVDRASFPADRTFRNAWEHDAAGSAVRVNLPKARTIHKDRLLARRDAAISGLQPKLDRADDAGDNAKIKSIKDARKASRNLDTTLDALLAALTTPEALAAFVPPEITALEAIS